MSLVSLGYSLISIDADTNKTVPSHNSSREPLQLMSSEPDTTRKMLGPGKYKRDIVSTSDNYNIISVRTTLVDTNQEVLT